MSITARIDGYLIQLEELSTNPTQNSKKISRVIETLEKYSHLMEPDQLDWFSKYYVKYSGRDSS